MSKTKRSFDVRIAEQIKLLEENLDNKAIDSEGKQEMIELIAMLKSVQQT